MLEALSDRLSVAVSRRGFLGTSASAAGAIALALFGIKPAYAALYDINGCSLCGDPAKCSFTNCACTWSWNGVPQDNGDGTCSHYLCKECYTSAVCPGASGCPNPGWKCSAAQLIVLHGTCPGGG